MLYESTRGSSPKLNFKEVVLSGLAPDGGLYMPISWPQFNLSDLRGLSYKQLAQVILKEFVGDSLSNEKLRQVIDNAYSSFPQPDMIPLRNLDDQLYLMELFHGPTHSFKDVAMQFIGSLFDQMLDADDVPVTILGATSGDTGSAAISAFAGKRKCRIIMLHPKGKISEVQRLQMTTVANDNVLNIAVDGDFDQCQAMVKALMSDQAFKAKHALTTVNSINWARIAAQSVYYAFYSLALAHPNKHPSFVVPSGNFGNAFSAFVARSMGFPVGHIHVATNSNDVLLGLINGGKYVPKETKATISPAMDIQWASNYERLLFALDDSGDDLQKYIGAYADKASCQLSVELQQKQTICFTASRVSEDETKAMILSKKTKDNMEIDPHTAVGLHVASLVKGNTKTPMVCLSTAHAAKFPETFKAVTGHKPKTTANIDRLWGKPEAYRTCAVDTEALKIIINEGC